MNVHERLRTALSPRMFAETLADVRERYLTFADGRRHSPLKVEFLRTFADVRQPKKILAKVCRLSPAKILANVSLYSILAFKRLRLSGTVYKRSRASTDVPVNVRERERTKTDRHS